MNLKEYLSSCKSCWWQEGGRCYVGTPERYEDGRSKTLATKKCAEYLNKRQALERVIPKEMLVITSEENAKRGVE